MNNSYHIPALLRQTVEGLDIKPDGIYVDATFGGGGHSRAILQRLGKHGRLFGFDRDADAVQNALDDPRFTFVRSNFRFLKNFLRYHNVEKVDGVLADLGVSFHHFDTVERGFSFRFNSPLDMRMNQKSTLTAADVVNTYTEQRLADIFYTYGELRQSRRIAQFIVNERNKRKITDTQHLIETLQPAFSKEKEKKELTLVFQAIRIEVNDELTALKSFLRQAVEILKPNGRFAVLTYHSLEDRLVKNFFRTGNFEGRQEKDFYGNLIVPLKTLNTKPIMPDSNEIESNPRARSAKLRIAEKLCTAVLK
ncbi:MAG: 16S rRNA (cytosine(1402)-N(4))-methyltransferase RsmH [Prevotellaceae bacterium]|jgi:16S rRNA (cytosine1402-N4)-methyltransferase|nr:16S rRNA (cytosine(1402)-N(4))-methyltransferase RsmH [Prevotellaceae bacterium]